MEKKPKTVTYTALTGIYSLQHKQAFSPGDAITWNLDDPEIPDFALLKSMGVLSDYVIPKEEVKPEPKPEPVTEHEYRP